jgi:hypothetical protein
MCLKVPLCEREGLFVYHNCHKNPSMKNDITPPFLVLCRYVLDRFRVTYLPSLLMLERVSTNEISSLRAQDDLEVARNQSCHGGISKLAGRASSMSKDGSESQYTQNASGAVDLKRVSNPRFVTTGVPKLNETEKSQPPQPTAAAFPLNREATFYSAEELAKSPRSRSTKSTKSTFRPVNPIGGAPSVLPSIPESHSLLKKSTVAPTAAPGPLEKCMSTHTFSTLTSKSATLADITTSDQVVTHFQQLSSSDRCVVYGSPQMPERLVFRYLYNIYL